MSTVHGWITQYVANNNIQYPAMPPTLAARVDVQSPLTDLIIVFGKGFIQFDNSPVSFITDVNRQQNPNAKWLISDQANGNLLLLFSQMTVALSGVSASWLNINPYLAGFVVGNAQFGT
jgi:hypothetical protein